SRATRCNMWILWDTTQIRGFRQYGNRVMLGLAVANRSSTAGAADILWAVTVPRVLRVRPILQSQLTVPASSAVNNYIADGDAGSAAQGLYQGVNSSQSDVTIVDHVYTNTAGQVRFTAGIGAGTITTNNLNGTGWWDDRGIYG